MAEMELGYAERAYDHLVRAIATCALPPGSLFNERDEAAKLDMSRTPFRQALHRLALEGLVVTVPKRGVRVSLLDPKEIHDNTVVREALEVELIRRAITDDLSIDFAELATLLKQMASHIDADDAEGFLRADEEFHLVIAEASGNVPAVEAIRRTWIHINRIRYIEHPAKSAMRAALREHRAMVKSLRQGDVEAGEAAVRAHMQRSRARLAELQRQVNSMFLSS